MKKSFFEEKLTATALQNSWRYEEVTGRRNLNFGEIKLIMLTIYISNLAIGTFNMHAQSEKIYIEIHSIITF